MTSGTQARWAGRIWWASTAVFWLHLLVFYAFVARVWLAVGHDPALVPDSPVHASSYYPGMQNAVIITALLTMYGGAPAQLAVLLTKTNNNQPGRLGLTLFNAVVLAMHLFGRHFYWFCD
jgi:hypothetical protein